VNERREIKNMTKTVRKIEIERLTRDDKEHKDDCREKTPDEKQCPMKNNGGDKERMVDQRVGEIRWKYWESEVGDEVV